MEFAHGGSDSYWLMSFGALDGAVLEAARLRQQTRCKGESSALFAPSFTPT